MIQTKTLQQLADYLGGTVRGDATLTVNGLAPLETAGPDKVTFLANPKYAAKVAETRAGAVLMAPGGEAYGRNVIELDNPYLGFAKLLTLFYTAAHPPLGVMPEAVIGTNVTLGEGISIYPGAVIGNQVTIGDRVVIHPGAVIYDGATIGDDSVIHANAVVRERCRMGKRCKLQPGAVIGSDGFGY
ncbi:MAG: LpxD N-terminal domain-containing protein, partial [Geobacter sp.]